MSRQVTTPQPTQAVVSRFSRHSISPAAGVTGLNSSQLAAVQAPTAYVSNADSRYTAAIANAGYSPASLAEHGYATTEAGQKNKVFHPYVPAGGPVPSTVYSAPPRPPNGMTWNQVVTGIR